MNQNCKDSRDKACFSRKSKVRQKCEDEHGTVARPRSFRLANYCYLQGKMQGKRAPMRAQEKQQAAIIETYGEDVSLKYNRSVLFFLIARCRFA